MHAGYVIMSLRLEVSNESEASIVDFNGVSARGTELLGGEAHELTVEHYVTGGIAYNHLRVVRVICVKITHVANVRSTPFANP